MSATRPKTSSWLTCRLGGWLPIHAHELNLRPKDTIDRAREAADVVPPGDRGVPIHDRERPAHLYVLLASNEPTSVSLDRRTERPASGR